MCAIPPSRARDRRREIELAQAAPRTAGLLDIPPALMTDAEYRQAVAGCGGLARLMARERARRDFDQDDLMQETFCRLLAYRNDRRAMVPFQVVLRFRMRSVIHQWRRQRAHPTRPVCTVTDRESRDGELRPTAVEHRPGPLSELIAREPKLLTLTPELMSAVDQLNPRSRAAVRRFLADGVAADAAHAARVKKAAVFLRRAVGPDPCRAEEFPGCRVHVGGRGEREVFFIHNGKKVYAGLHGASGTAERYAEIAAAVAAGRPVPRRTMPRFGYLRAGENGGQARVGVGGNKFVGLGRFGSPESIAKYHRICREHGVTPPPGSPPFPE